MLKTGALPWLTRKALTLAQLFPLSKKKFPVQCRATRAFVFELAVDHATCFDDSANPLRNVRGGYDAALLESTLHPVKERECPSEQPGIVIDCAMLSFGYQPPGWVLRSALSCDTANLATNPRCNFMGIQAPWLQSELEEAQDFT
jgi:hypothetical protein